LYNILHSIGVLLKSSEKKAALILSFEFPPYPGGIGIVSYHLAEELNRSGIFVNVMTKSLRFSPESDTAFDRSLPFPVFYFKDRKSRFLSLLCRIIDTIRFCLNHKISWIFCATYREAYGAAVCRLVFGIRFYIYGHGTEYMKHSPRKSLILNLASGLFANSRFTANIMQRVANKSVTIAHPAADTLFYNPRPFQEAEAFRLKEKYHIPDGPVLLSVGRVNPRKGHDITIKALKRIRYKFPQVRLIIIGKSMHGAEPFEQLLKEMIANFKLEENVILLPPVTQEELRGFYSIADVFILASRQHRNEVEGFGIVLLEANAMRVPVVASDFGGIPDAVQRRKTGFLFETGNSDDLADKVLILLGDPSRRHEMGAHGRVWATESFSWQKMAHQIMEIIQKINSPE